MDKIEREVTEKSGSGEETTYICWEEGEQCGFYTKEKKDE